MTEYENIVVLFGAFTGQPKILDLPFNQDCTYKPPSIRRDPRQRWKPDGLPTTLPDVYSLCFEAPVPTPSGWIFGSADDHDDAAANDACHFRLASDGESGISRQHFRIDYHSFPPAPKLISLTKNPIKIIESSNSNTVTLQENGEYTVVRPITIDLGAITLQMWRPSLSDQERGPYLMNIQKFHRVFLKARPISPENRKVPLLNRTWQMRFGLNGDRYIREGKKVESGGFGGVIKVREAKTGKGFGAKLLYGKYSRIPSHYRRDWESILAEAKKLFALNHPNIIRAIELIPGVEAYEPAWLVMDWAPFNLRAIDLETAEIPDIFRDICAGLAYMHSQGFTHRDIKQENILLAFCLDHHRWIAKICDLGLTKDDAHGEMRTFAGTALYLAPEMFNMAPTRVYDKDIDTWAAGCLLLELLSDEPLADTAWQADLSLRELQTNPSQADYLHWVDVVLVPRKMSIVADWRPLLDGSLQVDPRHRWTADRCVEWIDANPHLMHVELEAKTRAAAIVQDANGSVRRTSNGDDVETRIMDLSEARRLYAATELQRQRDESTAVRDDEAPIVQVDEHPARPTRKRALVPSTSSSLAQEASRRPSARKKGKRPAQN